MAGWLAGWLLATPIRFTYLDGALPDGPARAVDDVEQPERRAEARAPVLGARREDHRLDRHEAEAAGAHEHDGRRPGLGAQVVEAHPRRRQHRRHPDRQAAVEEHLFSQSAVCQ